MDNYETKRLIGRGINSVVLEGYAVDDPKTPVVIKKPLQGIDVSEWLREESLSVLIAPYIKNNPKARVDVPLSEIKREGEKVFVISTPVSGEKLTPERYVALSDGKKEKIARDLAAFFHTLHTLDIPVPRDPFKVRKGKYPRTNAFLRGKWERIEKKVMPVLPPKIVRTMESVIKDFEKMADDPALEAVCHYDLGEKNFFYRPETETVSVFDFGNAQRTDRHEDFRKMNLIDGFGEEITQRIIGKYNEIAERENTPKIDKERVEQYTVMEYFRRIAKKLMNPETTEDAKKAAVKNLEIFLKHKKVWIYAAESEKAHRPGNEK